MGQVIMVVNRPGFAYAEIAESWPGFYQLRFLACGDRDQPGEHSFPAGTVGEATAYAEWWLSAPGLFGPPGPVRYAAGPIHNTPGVRPVGGHHGEFAHQFSRRSGRPAGRD